MIPSSRSPLVPALILVVAASVAPSAVKFTSTWASPDARTFSFKGKKVAALVISDDMSLRVSGEEALVRELSSRSMQGMAAYRFIPREELKDVDRARDWFTRASIAGVVALRPLSKDKVTRYSPDVWVMSSYSSFWGYYPYGWNSVSVSGRVTTDTVVAVESLIFDIESGKLVWGGVSETTNPKTVQKLIADLVAEAAKKIEKQFR